jgi:hypothetical protein
MHSQRLAFSAFRTCVWHSQQYSLKMPADTAATRPTRCQRGNTALRRATQGRAAIAASVSQVGRVGDSDSRQMSMRSRLAAVEH